MCPVNNNRDDAVGMQRRAGAMQRSYPPAERPVRRRKVQSGPVIAAVDAAQSVAGSLLAGINPRHASGRVSGSEVASPPPGQADSLSLSDGTRIRFSRITADETLEPA